MNQTADVKKWYEDQGLAIPETPKIVDNWMFEQFMKCPRLYLLTVANGYRPAERKPALNFGTIMHIGLEVHYSLWDSPLAQRVAAATKKMREMWEGDPIGDHRTIDAACSLFMDYIEEYGDDKEFRPLVIDGEPIVEIGGTFEMNGFQYAINTDMLVEYRGEYYVVDHKTCSMMGNTWELQWRPNNQMTGYCVGVDKMYPLDKPVRGAIINGIKYTKSGNVELRRHVSLRSQQEKDEWITETNLKYQQLKLMHEQGLFGSNTQACMLYGGCAGRDFCEGYVDNRKRILTNCYEKSAWDPTNPPGRALVKLENNSPINIIE